MITASEFKNSQKDGIVRLGFVPLNDCAPLAVAMEKGFFVQQGLQVRLSRELGWATIRDKLSHGELDAAHGPCALPFALRATAIPCDCSTGLVLNLHGNAITMSDRLWQQGVRDAATLKQFLRVHRGQRILTLGIVSRYSSHSYLMRKWLESGEIDVEKETRLVVVPPPQMAGNLKAGHLDGYCSGEPWNSVAVAAGDGWIPATSVRLAPRHPEKVLVVRNDFTRRHREEHVALIAALLKACQFCDHPANRDEIVQILSGREYLNLPEPVIRRGWTPDFDCGKGRTSRSDEFTVFHRDDTNEPSTDKAAWVLNNLLTPELRAQFTPADLGKIFRSDLYHEALALSVSTEKNTFLKTHESPITLV
ncbi:MAG TPA: CmpA/NrtA family ABC transporter substrate-binding protein [Candidatus Limnocylindria bacterium]|jgi:ABC-type nitrate/sulfonate/bicarbonate transport system substrate-binding protein|nr:CmpA/NrtA family ABC transporter substrate-binding protein [Candidatus Limnocylindria bacterium]